MIYMLVSTGFVISVHYCMNKIDGYSFGTEKVDTCGKCGMHVEDAKGCCKDETQVVKLDLDQLTTKLLNFNIASPVILQAVPSYLTFPPLVTRDNKFAAAHGPPVINKDIHILHCVFRC